MREVQARSAVARCLVEFSRFVFTQRGAARWAWKSVSISCPSASSHQRLMVTWFDWLTTYQQDHRLLGDPVDVLDLLVVRPQDLHLFDATIRGNLRLARLDATDEEREAAAACARLRPWITSLPPGWETSVGAHGAAVAVSCHARYERFFAVSSRWGDVAGGWEMDRGSSEGRSQGSGDSGEVGAD